MSNHPRRRRTDKEPFTRERLLDRIATRWKEVLVAIIALISAVLVAALNNWGKFGSRVPVQPAVAASPTTTDHGSSTQAQAGKATPTPSRPKPAPAVNSKSTDTTPESSVAVETVASSPATPKIPTEPPDEAPAVSNSATAVNEQPEATTITLKSATVRLLTGWLGKEASTRVTILIQSASGGVLAKGETVGTTLTRYSTYPVVMSVSSGVTKDMPKPYTLWIGIATKDDTWKFKVYADLVWSDDSTSTHDFGEILLDESDSTATKLDLSQ